MGLMYLQFGKRYFVGGPNGQYDRNVVVDNLNARKVPFLAVSQDGHDVLLTDEGLPHKRVFTQLALGSDYTLRNRFFHDDDRHLDREVRRLDPAYPKPTGLGRRIYSAIRHTLVVPPRKKNWLSRLIRDLLTQ